MDNLYDVTAKNHGSYQIPWFLFEYYASIVQLFPEEDPKRQFQLLALGTGLTPQLVIGICYILGHPAIFVRCFCRCVPLYYNKRDYSLGAVLMSIFKRKNRSGASDHVPVLPTIKVLMQNYFRHSVGKNAAALAYYLLFALFPFLIFLSNLLGMLDFNISAIVQSLQRVMPSDVVGIIESYLQYASDTSNETLMWFALVFAILFPMRAAKGIMDSVRRAYDLKKPAKPIRYSIKQLIFTVLLFLVIGLTLVFSALGKQVLTICFGFLPEKAVPFARFMISLWHYLRFIPIGIMMFAALGILYAWALDEHQPLKAVRPGIILALSGWLLASVGFSFYVDHFANYTIIYGTLGAVIVLLMWLYLTGIVLILGAELNAALLTVKNGLALDDTAVTEEAVTPLE